jgi:outer membrane protein, heavy metal efflux system
MNSRAATALLATFALVASPGEAQTTDSAASFIDRGSGVSLDQAIARAREQEPSMRAARTAIDVARGTQLQAGLRRNPSLSMEFRGEPAGTDNQTVLSVEWPLDLFRRDGRIAVADREAAAAELSIADRERRLAADVRARYGDVLAAVRDLAIVEELGAAMQRQYDLLRSRVDAGAAPPIERDLLDVERRRLDAERLLLLGRTERAMIELKRSLGAPPAEPLRLRDTLEDAVHHDAASMPAAGSADARPDVREAEARVAVADARVDRAQRDGRLDISLFGGYMRMDSGFPQFGVSPAGAPERVHGVFHYLTGGAMVSLPLFNRNQGELASARAERAGAASLHAAARLSAQTDIAGARALDQRAQQAVQVYREGAKALAARNLSIVQQSYELGRTTIFEVLAEQKRYLEFERAFTDTLRAAYEARTVLSRALGEWR